MNKHSLSRKENVMLEADVQKWKDGILDIERQLAAESQQPTTYDDAKTPFTLGPKITDWDEQRARHLALNPGANVTAGGRPRVLLVSDSPPSWCAQEFGDHLLLRFLKNKLDYTGRHGIELYHGMASVDSRMDGMWGKQPLLRALMLQHPQTEWLWWVDADAIFTDMAFEIPWGRYKNFNFVLHGWPKEVYQDKNWWKRPQQPLDDQSYLVYLLVSQADKWSPKVWLEQKYYLHGYWVMLTDKWKRPQQPLDDQSYLVYLLVSQADKWSPKVWLEQKYYLHGYWVMLTDKYEEMMEKYGGSGGYGDARRPFLTHFVGCRPCADEDDGGVAMSAEDRAKCIPAMLRAFNFADNQVLEKYDFKHVSLNSPIVKHIDSN
eukprot:jgi/Mesen1/8583/ME000005S08549